MKNLTIIAFAFCALASLVAATSSTAVLTSLEKSKFGQEILSIVQLELASGVKDPRPKIITLLEGMRDNIQDQQNSDDSQFAEATSYYNSRVPALQQSILDYTKTVSQLSVLIPYQETELADAESLSGTKQQQIADAQAAQANADSTRADERAAYEEFQTKYTRLNEVLAEVRGYVQQRQDEVGASSFLQMPTELNLAQMESKIDEVSKISPAWGKVINFIKLKLKQTPTEVATRGFANILELIDRLLRTFSNNLQNSVETENERASQYNQATQERNARISDLQTEVAQLQNDITNLITSIADNKASLATAQDGLNSDQAELNLVQTTYAREKQEYEERTATRTEELDIIRQVLDIMNGQLSNLTDYMTKRINASDEDGVVPVGDI